MVKKKIILVRKKARSSGHHGGAWKVAYADFVTAMMALFIVLWLMNTSDHIRQVVAGYFNDPSGTSTETGSDRMGSGDSLPITQNNIAELKHRLEAAIHKQSDLKALSDQVQITITPDGLRIELLESKKGTFFDTGSATLSQNGRELLELLAKQLGSIPNSISLEGHTDSQPYALDGSYGNWELSADRANAARRLMQSTGLHSNQIAEVRGYADQKLRLPASPFDPSNRRISLIVQYMTVAPAKAVPAAVKRVPEPGSASAAGVSSSAPAPAAAPRAGAPSSTPVSPTAPQKPGNAFQRLAAKFHSR